MRLLFSLLFVVTSVLAQANEVTLKVSAKDYDQVGKPAFTPEVFLINRQGEFLLKFNQVTRDLAAQINAEHQVLGTVGSHPLSKVTKDKYNFADSDYTLVMIGDSEPKKFCPPCLIQAKINSAVLKQIKDKNIRLLNVHKVYSSERTIEFLPEEALGQYYPELKQ
ncbi:hypothetical protein EMM73_07590 [Rheinheimera sediminis]|uniref:hypothetical protein n=1 Tax=Rheinheimera sp. YQF-1 TaxID=2499626 RepID=UPI000FD8B38C|nr:hypothetical protein [Rheinheimera sp. YQF-1]RVT46727.1 hypothetical protein EMM73_07590 [Rheinheimera sp. YQF-1]